MTTLDLYRKHKNGEVSREKFLYEVRRDNNLPFITNLTSYDDAVKILKNKGVVTEVDTKEAKADEAVKAEVKAKAPSTKKPKELHIDYANPYEYRHGLQYELNELGEYTDEALEKAKSTVLKNLAKDVNFYSNLLNQKQSHYEFKQTETDKPGMQAKADGHLKKEAKKDEKSNVQDSLGKKEAGKKKPKGVKVMPDKGVTGSEKTIKEGFEVTKAPAPYDDQIEISDDSGEYSGFIEKNGKVSFSVVYDNVEDEFGEEGITEDNWKDVLGSNHAFVKIIDTIGGDVEAAGDYVEITVDADKLLNSNIKEGFEVTKAPAPYDDQIEISDDSGEYSGFIEKNGKVSFSVVYDNVEDEFGEEGITEDNWKDVLGSNHAFVKIIDTIGGDVEAAGDYVEITVDADKLLNSNIKEGLEEAEQNINEHHNDPNFPGGNKIHALLDKVADEWGKDSDVYSDLEDAIIGWSDRNGELTPKGKIAIRALLSNWDMLDDYEQFLDDKNSMEEDIQTSTPEDQFNQLMSKYDWYYEMSDDPRAYDRGTAMDNQLRVLGKQIGANKAVALFNDKAPSDRKVTSSFFMEGKEDKHAKLKEVLKAKVKEAISSSELIQAKQKGQVIKIPKSATQDIQAAERAKANYSTYE